MNSNKKHDFYKNSLYYLIANAVLLLIGIIVVSIFGFNYGSTITGGKLLFTSSLSLIISLVLVLIYVGLRHGFARAFSIVLVSVHNVLLSTAVIGIIRIPISEALVMGYLLLVGLTTIFTLIMTEKLKDVNLKKANYHEIIKNSMQENVKKLAILSAILVVILLLSLIVGTSNIFNLARILFVMIIVLIYSSLTINLPIWLFFSSKIKRVKRAQVDENVENQKVVKAVAVEGGDNSSPAETEIIEQ